MTQTRLKDMTAANRHLARMRTFGPGLVIAGVVALAASWLAEHYGAPVMLFALLLGIAVNFLSQDPRCKPGLEFASRTILRLGVALLGMRITFDQIQSLGAGALALTAVAVVLTIASGWLLARSARLEASFGVLTGGRSRSAARRPRSRSQPCCRAGRRSNATRS